MDFDNAVVGKGLLLLAGSFGYTQWVLSALEIPIEVVTSDRSIF